jgi:hypothetical protein
MGLQTNTREMTAMRLTREMTAMRLREQRIVACSPRERASE